MMKFSSSLILIAAFYAGNVVFADGNAKQCPGGYDDGARIDIGRYWYECREGQVIPKGCLSEDGRRVDVDATFDTATYRLQCVRGSDGFLTVIYKACIYENAEHDIGAQWDNGVAYFTCVKDGNNVRVTMLGCVDQGKQLKFDERVAKGDFIYQCKKATDGTPTLNKVGCVHEGRKYNIGETYEAPKFWYTCTDSGSKIIGCMYESHRLQDNDQITKGDTNYECKVNGEKTDFVAFACLARDDKGTAIQRKVGCVWQEGQGSENYEYTCKLDSSTNQVTKVQTQCVYRSSQGVFMLGPGCVQLAESIAVGCRHDSNTDKLQIETFNAEKIDQLPGLRKCN